MSTTNTFTIEFDARHRAQAIRLPAGERAEQALARLNLPDYKSVVVMHGGAGGMDAALTDRVREFLALGLVPFAEEQRVLVADGATDVGAVRALGQARERLDGTFPLLGITPHHFATYPGGPTGKQRYPLNPQHSHFVLVEGDAFGDESDVLVGLLRAANRPGLALIINGGEIVLREVGAHARAGNTVVAVRGTGRAADALSAVDVKGMPAGLRLRVADLNAPGDFARLLGELLGRR